MVINNTYTYTLPTAGIGSGGILGGVRVDNSTIFINGSGVISSTAGLPATIRLTPTPTDGFYSWINSQALLAKTPSTGVLYSSGSADGDIVLRSDTDKALILQSGIGDPAITLTAGLNRVRIHQRVGINTLPNTNYWLDVNGSINATQIRVGGNVGSADNILEVGSILKIASNSGTERLTITSTGVQVNHTLNVSSGLNAGGLIRLGGFADDSSFDLAIIQNREYVANKSELLLFKGDNIENTNGVDRIRLRSGAIAFDTYSTDLTTSAITENIRMYIDGNGRVGIGITNPPFSLLHLHKTATLQDVRIQITDGTSTSVSNRGLAIGKGTDNRSFIFNYENTGLFFGTNAVERMTISNTGNVDIVNILKIGSVNGTTGTIKLQVYSADADGICAIFKHPNDTQGLGFKFNEIFQTNINFPLLLTTTGTGSIVFNTGSNERFRIASNGYVGIGGSPSYKFHMKINYDSVATGFHLDADDTGGFNPDKYALTIWAYVIGSGQVGWKFRTQSSNGGVNTPLAFTNIGAVNFLTDRWHGDSDNNARMYLQTGSTTFIRGYGSTPIEFRGGTDIQLATISSQGHLTCYFQSFSGSGMDYTGVLNAGEITTNNWRTLRVIFGTFTGYHRCYTDDDLCNDENIDIFKNEYMGRIVISTGKIKTDVSIKKNKEPITEPTEPIEEYEWNTLCDKQGITIEDALPIIQLSRVRKDKRIYGVLGDPKRATNNKGRIIINSVGEGAICVCNTNGNIENGDYIQSSELLGFGEKQDDDILHNYSVAKSVMDCTFDLDSPYYQCYEIENGVRVAFIACTYHAG
jgi:hypothetical protein